MGSLRRSWFLTRAALMVAAGLGAQGAQAGVLCLQAPDPEIESLSQRAGQDPQAALQATQVKLETDQTLSAEQRAWLYAVRAAAYWALSQGRETEEASAAGLALAPDPKTPVHVQLLIYNGKADFRIEAIEAAIPRFEAARTYHPKGSPENLCLQIALGDTLLQVDRIEEAVTNLQEAYLNSQVPGHERQRVHAAMALAQFMRYAGDYDQALSLLREQIEWDTRYHHTHALSADHYYEARYNRLAGRASESIRHYDLARQLSVPFNDTLGDAYIDLEKCMALTDMGKLKEATALCEDARKVFAFYGEDAEAEAQIQLAEVALKQHQPAKALALLNAVFSSPAAKSTAISTIYAYQFRAQANAELGNHAQAYADLSEYLRQFTKRYEMERVRLMAAQRAQLEIHRQIEQNEKLSHELKMAQQHQRQQDRQQLLMLVVALLLIGGLLTGIVISRRHQRALQEVARKDSLTGLNNRRRTVELAKQAFLEAAATRGKATVAIIDLDHFKHINDTWGHAAGDRVLSEFASILQKCARADHIIGRWGGEEFIIVLPGSGEEEAVAVLERIRAFLSEQTFAFAPALRVTFSAGVASGRAPKEPFRVLLDRADQALYRAKAEGRNRICVHEHTDESSEAHQEG